MESFLDVLPSLFEYGYVALTAIMFLGGFYLPVPSNTVLVAAGALSHISYDGLHFNIFLAAAIALIASILGDIGSYYVARRIGHHKQRRERFEAKYKTFVRVGNYLKRHPIRTVSITRLIGFLSPVVNTLSGFTKLPIRIFIIGDIIGNVIYVALFMGAGYLIGSQANNLGELITYTTALLAGVAVIYIGAIIFMQRR